MIDLVFVTSKLQAVIASQLIQYSFISRRYLFVGIAPSVNDLAFYTKLFQELRQGAIFSIILSQDLPAHKVFPWIYICTLIAKLCRGAVFLASYNYFYFPLAFRLALLPQIKSFDDGLANLDRNSTLSQNLDAPRCFPTGLYHYLFPHGYMNYMRSTITHHFTIYTQKHGVTTRCRTTYIPINWLDQLKSSEIKLLPQAISNQPFHILLGAPYQDIVRYYKVSASEIGDILSSLLPSVNLYIPHPRNSLQYFRQINYPAHAHSNKLSSPAEAIIAYYLADKCSNLVVTHFNSSAVLPFLYTEANFQHVNLLANRKYSY
jgi:hypothetical protein